MGRFEVMSHPGWVVTVAGDKFVYHSNNDYHRQLTGLGDVAGLTPDDLQIDPYLRKRIKDNYRRCVVEKRTIQYEEMFPIKSSVRWWQTTLQPIFDAEENVVEIIGVSTDITELKNALASFEQFIYIISHDMQSPISAIVGLAGMLQERSEDNKELIELIVQSAKEASEQIAGLLEYSRSNTMDEAGQVDVNELVKKIARTVEGQVVYDNLAPCWGNEKAIRTVFQNLIGNAVKYTKKRELALIEVGYTEDAQEYIFYVRDNGAGFDMNYAQKLFGVFQRLHSTEDFEGTGIGLANVRQFIKKHNGRTWAEGEIDKGATFYFSLPKI